MSANEMSIGTASEGFVSGNLVFSRLKVNAFPNIDEVVDLIVELSKPQVEEETPVEEAEVEYAKKEDTEASSSEKNEEDAKSSSATEEQATEPKEEE